MEQHKRKKARVQAVKAITFLILIAIGYIGNAQNDKSDNSYYIERTSANDGRSKFKLSMFEFEDRQKLIPGYVVINGVAVFSDDGNKEVLVKPGAYFIECGFVGKKKVKLKSIRIKEGEEISISFFLADVTEEY
jgi:hypothetical protein